MVSILLIISSLMVLVVVLVVILVLDYCLSYHCLSYHGHNTGACTYPTVYYCTMVLNPSLLNVLAIGERHGSQVYPLSFILMILLLIHLYIFPMYWCHDYKYTIQFMVQV
jgi:hypothetical protein